jgi:C1A family cysteine protease
MAKKTGTLLSEVMGFPQATADRLAELWITTAEELASAAEQTNGRVLIGQYLGLGDGAVTPLLDAIQAVLPTDVDFAVEDIPVVLGALPVDGVAKPEDEPVAFADLPGTVDLHATMPPIRYQGSRSTCVAHAAAAVREYLLGEHSSSANLSEQFIYWACKERDGRPAPGTWIKTAMGVLQELGVCPETAWPYNASLIAGNEGQGPAPANAAGEAAGNRIVSYRALNATWVDSLRAALAAGSPVAFSVRLYESCQRPYGYRSGDMRLPLPNERELGGHAMCMVGYVDDDQVPGGGYFIVRNSWGEAFGHEGEETAGYCRIPYAYLRQYGIEAYTAEM